jgi:drug/metabolite transporter (DMT)-like permease
MKPSCASSLRNARLLIVLAAVLWSLGGLFTRVLQRDTFFDVNQPELSPLQMAFYRAFFAGLLFLPLLKRSDVVFRPPMFLMVAFFALMNALFLSALALGSAANAILLQNTAPFWVYLIGVSLLGDRRDARSLHSILIGMVGVGVIVGGGWWRDGPGKLEITLMALGSALMYAGVILSLRKLNHHSSLWLTAINHLGTAVLLGGAIAIIHGPLFCWEWLSYPTARQLAFLAVFGATQMAIPYALFARGLKRVTPQEAGMIGLIEPLLNPIWAYLISPETDTPPLTTWIGGGFVMAALGRHYLFRPAMPRAGEPQLPEIID